MKSAVCSAALLLALFHGLVNGRQLRIADLERLKSETLHMQAKYVHSLDSVRRIQSRNLQDNSQDEDLFRAAQELERAQARRKQRKRGFEKSQGTQNQSGYFLPSRDITDIETNPVTLSSVNKDGTDNEYYGSIGVGQPKQIFQMLLDTGSSDIWVPGEKSSSAHRKYATGRSSAYAPEHRPWNITYGTGTASGTIVEDDITFAGFTVPKQHFALAETAMDTFEGLPSDGVFGLGFGAISRSSQRTFLENLIVSRSIASPELGLYLESFNNDSANALSSLCMGCVDEAHLEEPLSYYPVTVKGYWQIEMDGIMVDAAVAPGTAIPVAIDSGTTLIYLPSETADAFYKTLGGVRTGNSDGTYMVPCDSVHHDYALSFGNKSYSISYDDILLGYLSEEDTRHCVLGVLALDQRDPHGNPVGIVGGPLLKSNYASFTYSHNGKPAVGLARSTNTTGGLARPTSTGQGLVHYPMWSGVGAIAPLRLVVLWSGIVMITACLVIA